MRARISLGKHGLFSPPHSNDASHRSFLLTIVMTWLSEVDIFFNKLRRSWFNRRRCTAGSSDGER